MADEKTTEQARELLVGAYDLHVHTSPSPFPRHADSLEIIRSADEVGMAGIVLKSHYDCTASRAQLINRHSGCKTKAYGGVALNRPVGGLNPYAVENALKLGASIIWMPTRDYGTVLRPGTMPLEFEELPGIRVFSEDGTLKEEMFIIFELIRQHDACLATGHLKPEEAAELCRIGRAHDVRMILTHPEYPATDVPVEIQKELAELGVYIEKCWYNIMDDGFPVDEMVGRIREVGINHCFLCTDRGQKFAPHPVDEYKAFLICLLKQGFTPDEIRIMSQDVPQRILRVK